MQRPEWAWGDMGGRRTEAGHNDLGCAKPLSAAVQAYGGHVGLLAWGCPGQLPRSGVRWGQGAAHPEVEGPRTRAAVEADSCGQTPGKRWFCGLVS